MAYQTMIVLKFVVKCHGHSTICIFCKHKYWNTVTDF